MTLLQGSFRSLISAGLRGAALVSALNTHLVANTPDNRMVTVFYGELDTATGRLTYVNAGHNPPYLYDGDCRSKLDATGVVLGMLDGMPFPEMEVELRDDARLLLYTDGITEAANPAGEEFGEARLEALIDEQGLAAPVNVIDALVTRVVGFCGKAEQHDDMTMMLVSRARP